MIPNLFNKIIMVACFLQRVNSNSAVGVYSYRAGFNVRDFD